MKCLNCKSEMILIVFKLYAYISCNKCSMRIKMDNKEETENLFVKKTKV